MNRLLKKTNFALVTLCAISTGCGTISYVERYYSPNPYFTTAENRSADDIFIPWSGKVVLVNASGNFEKEIKEARRNNFFPLGGSTFFGTSSYYPRQDVDIFGNSIEADLAVWAKDYRDTITGTRPTYAWVPGTTTTTTTTASGEQIGPFPSGQGNTYINLDNDGPGESTTTTEGRRVPIGTENYSVERSNYNVKFFKKKARAPKFGVSFIPLTDDIKKELETNSGVLIEIIHNGSPAYKADLFEGDIILEVNGKKIFVEDFVDLINKNAGELFKLKIYRQGVMVNKEVQLNK